MRSEYHKSTGGLVCIFSFGENRGVADVQPSASDAPPRRIFLSSPLHFRIKRKTTPNGVVFFLVETGGLEPSTSCV